MTASRTVGIRDCIHAYFAETKARTIWHMICRAPSVGRYANAISDRAGYFAFSPRNTMTCNLSVQSEVTGVFLYFACVQHIHTKDKSGNAISWSELDHIHWCNM